jgi:hypothetical protein
MLPELLKDMVSLVLLFVIIKVKDQRHMVQDIIEDQVLWVL